MLLSRCQFFSQCLADVPSLLCGMTRASTSGSDTSTQRSTSGDDTSQDGNNFELMRTQEVPYGNYSHSSAEVHHLALRTQREYQVQPLPEPPRAIIPQRHRRINMEVVVDLEALFPDGTYDYYTGKQVANLDNIHIFTFTSYTQLQELNVDYIKREIQDLCWECFGSPLRKRDFKLWLQVLPPVLPRFPYGCFEPLNYDILWIEVLNSHQIPFGQRLLHIRAHHPESIFD